jgi:glycosyltransferase involved in cell wall biosynthesis
MQKKAPTATTKIKTAAVYDRWLHTLGGGEQVAFAYAEVLRDLGYKVDLLTHSQLDLDTARQKMDVDLKNISIRYLPNLLDYQLSQYTEEYDVFVSNSYMDYIPNRSKKGILSVFFPSKIALSWYEYLKRAHLVPSLRNFFIYPSQFEGFRYDSFEKRKLHKWLGKVSRISFNKPLSSLELTFSFEQLAFSVLDQIEFYADNTKLEPQQYVNHRQNLVTFRFDFKPNLPVLSKLIITLPESMYASGVSLVRMSIPNWRYWFYNKFKRLFPMWEMRLHGGPSVTKYSDIDSYQKILPISKFSQHWINKYWHLPSEVLYPPVSIHKFKAATNKKNIILHVGRFFVGGHSKKQLEMLRVFKELVDAGHTDWELHFIGGVAHGSLHRAYVDKIKDEAEGYPVHLHTDAPFSLLQNILSQAKLYWHATGLDENDQKYPVMLEHFGITTVEAMAAGCVPIVINKGGQPEIVTKEAGYVWETRKQLFALTEELMHNEEKRQEMSLAAIERSKDFSMQVFRKKLRSILTTMDEEQ